jgi:hypothetical protein
MPMKLLLLSLLVICGCNTTYVEKHPDGTTKAGNSRWFWSTESYDIQYNTNGTFRAQATKSNPDAESLKAVAQGAAQGAAQGLKP